MIRLALINLLRQKTRSSVTALGVAVAIGMLFLLLSFQRGYQDGLHSELDRLGAHLIVVPKGCPYDSASIALHGASWPCYLKSAYLTEVEQTLGVGVAAPVLMNAYFDSQTGAQSVYCGVTERILGLRPHWRFAQGGFPKLSGGILIGAELAKARGCRVIGIAGGADKCNYVTKELGFDACLDYKQHKDAVSLAKALKEAAPDGVDGYFENVGGMVMDAVMPRMNAGSRIALCGMIAGYDGQPVPMSYPQLILTNRMKVQGFIVSEHPQIWPEALKELGALVGSGKLRPRESIAQGLEAAPEAFLGLLKGRNFGKQLVKLA